jgi:hypothetical protein
MPPFMLGIQQRLGSTLLYKEERGLRKHRAAAYFLG